MVSATTSINGIIWKYSIINGRAKILQQLPYKDALKGGMPICLDRTILGRTITVKRRLQSLDPEDRALIETKENERKGFRFITPENRTSPDSVISNTKSTTDTLGPMSGGIDIPSMINGCPVVCISDLAFSGCNSLTTVTIPDSVTHIGNWAFLNCVSLISVTIPDSVTSIGEYAFSGCSSLATITIPDSVTSIGNYAFKGCSSLKSIPIGNGVTRIGYETFSGCSSLVTVTIPDSVTDIGDHAFSGCTSLESISIGNGVTRIGYETFSKCYSLQSVAIPESITEIEWNAFADCCSLKAISVSENNRNYLSKDGLLLSKSKKTLIRGVNGDIIIPDTITWIDDYAFSGCSSLTSVTIPDNVTSIGDFAFSGCRSLKNVTIPDSVIYIGNGAFQDCNSLLDISIKGVVADIKWLNEINDPESNEIYGEYEPTLILFIMDDGSIKAININAFNDCNSVTIGDQKFDEGNICLIGNLLRMAE